MVTDPVFTVRHEEKWVFFFFSKNSILRDSSVLWPPCHNKAELGLDIEEGLRSSSSLVGPTVVPALLSLTL